MISPSQNFYLDSGQLEMLKKSALIGDSEACEKLSNYYEVIELDMKLSIFWLEKAIEYDPNNSRLKNNLAVTKATL